MTSHCTGLCKVKLKKVEGRMKKSEFEEIERTYHKSRRRLEAIKPRKLVWEAVPRGIDMDYHPAVVERVNVDEACVDVIDVTMGNERKTYIHFLTEQELMRIEPGITREVIDAEYQKYQGIINGVVVNNL